MVRTTGSTRRTGTLSASTNSRGNDPPEEKRLLVIPSPAKALTAPTIRSASALLGAGNLSFWSNSPDNLRARFRSRSRRSSPIVPESNQSPRKLTARAPPASASTATPTSSVMTRSPTPEYHLPQNTSKHCRRRHGHPPRRQRIRSAIRRELATREHRDTCQQDPT